MLAYLDDQLDSGETQELEQKIEESSFASGLVHRIRDSARRLRLGAPKVDGKGIGLDANSVAEYLDSTLPSERVPDFEKVCLESDVHLAEVASSHQILTVVCEPAEVSPELRDRVYRIGQAAAVGPASGGISSRGEIEPANGSVAVAAATGTNGSHVVKAPGPNYPQTQSGVPIKSLLITLALVFLIALAALQLIGVDRIKSLFGVGPTVAQAPQSADPAIATSESHERMPEPETSPAPSDVVASPVAEQATPLSDASEQPAEAIQATEGDLVPMPTKDSPSVGPAKTSGADDVASAPAAEEVATAPGSEAVESAEVPAKPAKEAMPVGRYISNREVVASFNQKENAWYPLLPDAPLRSGDRLVVLPTYRPQLLLSPGLLATVAGESLIELGVPKETSEPEISIEPGRLLLLPVGAPHVLANLTLAGRRATLRFADEQSRVAVEVKHYLAPGSDAKPDSAPRVVQVYSLSGKIGWEEVDRESMEINAGEVLTFIADDPAGLYEGGPFPQWLDGSDLTDIDRQSSAELLRYLTPDRPLSLSLMERTEFRRVEIRALASQSLCTLDIFDPSLEALNDESQHSYWARQVDALRSAMARSPESAAKVERSVEKLSGEQSSTVHRLLQGYSPEQLASGGAEEVVAALEHDRMSIRVLAHENLRRITGKKRNFHPERAPKLEKSKVMNWQRDREAGLIVYETPPSPLPPREPISR
jgi:hypothetical protein